jgi:hypothetical protein
MLPDPADPRTLDLIERLAAIRMGTRQALLVTRLAIEATEATLRASQTLLADRLCRPGPPSERPA